MTSLALVVIGGIGGVLTALWAHGGSAERERRIFRNILIAMQVIYVLFTLFHRQSGGGEIGGGLGIEIVVLVFFVGIALAGERLSLWFLALGYLAHGGWDFFHLLRDTAYVPGGYEEACLGYDWLLFAHLARRSFDWVKGSP